MNRHYSKHTENYGYKYRNDFSDESLPAFFLLLLYIGREETRLGRKTVYPTISVNMIAASCRDCGIHESYNFSNCCCGEL